MSEMPVLPTPGSTRNWGEELNAILVWLSENMQEVLTIQNEVSVLMGTQQQSIVSLISAQGSIIERLLILEAASGGGGIAVIIQAADPDLTEVQPDGALWFDEDEVVV